MILNFNDAAVKAAPDGYGKDVLLFAIPPKCITGIVIGSRADKTFTSKLRELVAQNAALGHVVFKQSVVREGVYSVVDEAG